MPIDSFTPETVAERLCRAGRTLMALHVPGCRPAGYRTAMLAVLSEGLAQEFGIDYLLRAQPIVRIDRPVSADIDDMDRCWKWIAVHLAGGTPVAIRHRRVMLMRSLIHPKTDRHIASFRAIADELGVSHAHVKVLWENGLERIAAGLNHGPQRHSPRTNTLAQIQRVRKFDLVARNMLARD